MFLYTCNLYNHIPFRVLIVSIVLFFYKGDVGLTFQIAPKMWNHFPPSTMYSTYSSTESAPNPAHWPNSVSDIYFVKIILLLFGYCPNKPVKFLAYTFVERARVF